MMSFSRFRKRTVRGCVLSIFIVYFLATGCDAPPAGKKSAGRTDTEARSTSPTGPVTDVRVDGKTSVPVSRDHERENLHAAFSMTMNDLQELVSSLPAEIRNRITEDPEGFLDAFRNILRTPAELLVLVDKEHPLPEGYAPADLVRLEDYGVNVNRTGLEFRKAGLDEFLEMKDAARDAGLTIPVISAYRSYSYQVTVYSNHVAKYGREAAERESARPGKSQHQLGTALDLGSLDDDFGSTPLGKWLRQNAWKYGFSLSYPENAIELTGYKYEPWHFRFIGTAAAAAERTYFGGIQHYFLQFHSYAARRLRSALKE